MPSGLTAPRPLALRLGAGPVAGGGPPPAVTTPAAGLQGQASRLDREFLRFRRNDLAKLRSRSAAFLDAKNLGDRRAAKLDGARSLLAWRRRLLLDYGFGASLSPAISDAEVFVYGFHAPGEILLHKPKNSLASSGENR